MGDHSRASGTIGKARTSAGRGTLGSGVFTALVASAPYRLLWISSVLTQIGQWMLQVATAWLMLELTDSALWVGLLGFAGGVPFLLVAAPAGALSERIDRRTMMLGCQAGAFALGGSLAVLVLTGRATPLVLLVATFLNGILLAANNATRQAVIPYYVESRLLQNAVALLSAGMNTTRIVGPSLAGPLVATLGVGGTLLLQAACLGAALLSTSRLPVSPPTARRPEPFLRGLVGGVAYVRRAPVVLALMLLASVPTLLVFPYLQLLPVFAREVLGLGPSGLGLLYTVGGSGALAGSLFVAGVRSMRRRGLAMVAIIVVYGLVVATFTTIHWLPVVVCCLFAAGFLGSSYMALNNALLHLAIDDEVRGRVMGLYMVTWGFMPLGALPMGALGDAIGIDRAILVGALASSLVSLLVARRVPGLLRLS
ncbi:MAG: MFS transporter [Thermomicrobium sp.]|nr:MFS transporter [Thermomicrobium sp.]